MSTTTARSRKSKLPGKPAPGTNFITCARPGCGREFPPAEDRAALEPFPGAGDFRAVRDSSRVAGWLHDEEIGDVCPSHRDLVSRWPGAPRLALPARVAGSTRAEFLGVVPVAALPPPDVSRSGCSEPEASAAEVPMSGDRAPAGPGHTPEVGPAYVMDWATAPADGDLEPLPPLPQRKPGRVEAKAIACHVCGVGVGKDCLNTVTHEPMPETVHGGRVAKWEQQSQPGGTTYPGLTPAALAGGVPLESLAPEQEDEVKR